MLRSPTALAVVLVLLVGIGAGACTHGDARATAGAGEATVVRVVDGDTIVVRIRGENERVRLIGIDTPESVKPNSPTECFGREAAGRTKALLPEGTPVRLVRDIEPRDNYGRLLAYVYREPDDLFVNLALAKEGYATTLTLPPNVAHTDEFVEAARAARERSRGLWGKCSGSGALPSRP